MKVLHLPTDTGGNAFGLSRAERELGLTSDVLYRYSNFFNYPADIALCKTRSKPLALLAATLSAFTVPQKYDVLHFNFGSSLIDAAGIGINHWDLPLYKKQKLFVTYNGNDARMSFETMYPGQTKRPDYIGVEDPLYADLKTEKRLKARIAQFEKAGAGFFALNPDLVRVLPKGAEFMPYAIAGYYSIDTEPYKPSLNKLKIVHAPTNRVIKGTRHILEAVGALEKKYPGKIELQLVEGVDNETAKKIYRDADVIVDQLRVGWYGAFSVEAMKMGKPVVAYLNREDMKFIPPQMAEECKEAFIEADCDTIGQVLERCLHDEGLLQMKAAAGLEYVNKWHDPVNIARRVKAAYEGETK